MRRRSQALLLLTLLLGIANLFAPGLIPPADGAAPGIAVTGAGPLAPALGLRSDPFPVLDLDAADVALTVDGTPYPRVVIEGYRDFVRRQATARGEQRSFYEWGELLHLFDTATERVLAARAAWGMGLRATSDDLADFSRYTLDSSPRYLDDFYGGSRELFEWDAQLQILMKKWMAYVTKGAKDVTWRQAGELMKADEQEFASWDTWYRPARARAQVVTFPERIARRGDAPASMGLVLLLVSAAALLLLVLRGMAKGGRSDLLVRWPSMAAAVRRRIYPEGVRVVLLAVFVLMLTSLAVGDRLPHRNLGSVYLWILWWPAVPFLLFFSGRSWCAVCPIATLGDVAQRLRGPKPLSVPRAVLVTGIWVVDGTFLAVTWFDRSVGMVSSVSLTLTALLLLTGAALTAAVLLPKRAFCRHLCFFGALAGNYSMASMVELRARQADCRGCRRDPCLRAGAAQTEADGCPMLERPRALASNRDCNLCLRCVRTCERGALAVRLRDPLGELASVRQPRLPIAALAAVLVGVVAVQNLGMLEVTGVVQRRLQAATGLGTPTLTSLTYLLALLLPLLLLALASRGDRRTFAFFGYALIPLDLGAHAAHNLLHLLGEGKSVWWVTADLVGLTSPLDIPGGHPGGSMGAALLDASSIRVLQLALVLLAAGASLAVARRMGRHLGTELDVRPLYALLVVLAAANLWLFSVPMALRH